MDNKRSSHHSCEHMFSTFTEDLPLTQNPFQRELPWGCQCQFPVSIDQRSIISCLHFFYGCVTARQQQCGFQLFGLFYWELLRFRRFHSFDKICWDFLPKVLISQHSSWISTPGPVTSLARSHWMSNAYSIEFLSVPCVLSVSHWTKKTNEIHRDWRKVQAALNACTLRRQSQPCHTNQRQILEW